jgi:protein-tyrosine phosphatase
MIKVLFVCLGNICRSPMAEYVFKDMVRKRKLDKEFYIDSAATSNEEIGNGMHYGTIKKLKDMNIKFDKHKARRITKEDYKKFDYIIGMEERNVKDILKICGQDTENKVYKLLDFSDNPRDIADPWYTGNFDITYNDIVEGLEGFIKLMN